MKVCLRDRGIALLDFSSHDSATASPKEVIALQVIECLDASHNRIAGVSHLSVFTSLRVLDLSHNKLASPVIPWLKALPVGLLTLNLSHNEISSFESSHRNSNATNSIGAAIAVHLPRLTSLDLSNNMLHASAAEEEQDGSDRSHPRGSAEHLVSAAPVPCQLTHLTLDNNTGIFSLNSLLRDLPCLEVLSATNNHIESLEAVANVAESCPKLTSISLTGCPVSDKLQDSTFLWNIIGGDTIDFGSRSEQNQAIRDTAKLAQYFLAVLVSQVVPAAVVDGVSVSEARELVGPLLARSLNNGEAEPNAAEVADEPREDDPTEDDESENSSDSEDVGEQVAQEPKTKMFDETGGEPSNARPSSAVAASFEQLFSSSSQKHYGVASRTRPHSSGTPRHILDRMDFLQQRSVQLQEFIIASQRNTRHFEQQRNLSQGALKATRQAITDQRNELAAVRLEREAQLDVIRTLQQQVRKKTLELDHANVTNIRVVEKKLDSLIQQKESVIHTQDKNKKREELKQRSLTGVDAFASSKKPTRSTIRQLEETQRRLRHLKEVSPTAALGSRFVYDEYGNPSFAGDPSDGDCFPESARLERGQDTAHRGASPAGASRALRFGGDSPKRSEEMTGPTRSRASSAHQQQAQVAAAASAKRLSSVDRFTNVTVSESPEGHPEQQRQRSLSLTQAGDAVVLPRRSFLVRSSEPDHNDTTITNSPDANYTMAGYGSEPSEALPLDTSHIPTALSTNATHLEDSSVLSSFKFPTEEVSEASNRLLEVNRRRLSSLQDPKAVASVVENAVAAMKRRSTMTGHVDGQLSNPTTSLPLSAEMSAIDTMDERFTLNNSRIKELHVSELLDNDGDHAGAATSIAQQSPSKRMSETTTVESRRRPSARILEQAAEELHEARTPPTTPIATAAALRKLQNDASIDAERMDHRLNHRASAMLGEEGMSAAPRMARGVRSSSTATPVAHPYDIVDPLNRTLSLDTSVSKMKPSFRRATTF